MSLKRDREPVEVKLWGSDNWIQTVRTTRYIIHKDGTLSWIHPLYRTELPPRFASRVRWRKVKA